MVGGMPALLGRRLCNLRLECLLNSRVFQFDDIAVGFIPHQGERVFILDENRDCLLLGNKDSPINPASSDSNVMKHKTLQETCQSLAQDFLSDLCIVLIWVDEELHIAIWPFNNLFLELGGSIRVLTQIEAAKELLCCRSTVKSDYFSVCFDEVHNKFYTEEIKKMNLLSQGRGVSVNYGKQLKSRIQC